MNRAKIGLVMVGMVLSFVAPALRAEDAGKENAELRAKVEALQRQNAELSAKLEAMRADVARVKAEVERMRKLDAARQELKGIEGLEMVPPAPAQPPVMVLPKEEKTMPPGTVERKFNGVSVYVVPLE
jgi:cell division protein FtsB